MIAIGEEAPEEYAAIDWKNNDGKCLNVRYKLVHPIWTAEESGVSKAMISFIKEYAANNGYSSVRADAFATNEVFTKAFDAEGFSENGEYYRDYQKIPHKCYEIKL